MWPDQNEKYCDAISSFEMFLFFVIFKFKSNHLQLDSSIAEGTLKDELCILNKTDTYNPDSQMRIVLMHRLTVPRWATTIGVCMWKHEKWAQSSPSVLWDTILNNDKKTVFVRADEIWVINGCWTQRGPAGLADFINLACSDICILSQPPNAGSCTAEQPITSGIDRIMNFALSSHWTSTVRVWCPDEQETVCCDPNIW